MTNTRIPDQAPELPDSARPTNRRRPLAYVIASHLVRVVLILGLLALLTGVPTNIDTWNDPGASVLPSERTMPAWGNYVLGLVSLIAVIALALGWFARAVSPLGARTIRAAALTAAVGMTTWAAVLFTSQVISMRPQEGLVSAGIGLYGDAIFGVLALATAAALVRDALTRWHPAA